MINQSDDGAKKIIRCSSTFFHGDECRMNFSEWNIEKQSFFLFCIYKYVTWIYKFVKFLFFFNE